MKKLFAFLFVLAFAAMQLPAFPQRTEQVAITEAYKTLKGTWNWTESSFASRGTGTSIKTPESTKQQVSVTFVDDKQASLFVNNKLVGTYTYTLTKPMNEYLIIRFLDIQFSPTEGREQSEFLPEGPLTFDGSSFQIAGGYNDAGSNVKFKKAAAAKKITTKKKTSLKKTQK